MSILASLRRLLIALVLLTHACAFGVTPVTPRFTVEARSLLFRQLDHARVPSVGQNSVALAILSALGTEPGNASFEYDEPFPQLPKVTVTTRLREPNCVFVSAIVRGATATEDSRVLVTGNFCRVGTAQWTSTDIRAVPAGSASTSSRSGARSIHRDDGRTPLRTLWSAPRAGSWTEQAS